MADNHPRVLVVDDERFYRDAVCETLDSVGIACATAESGEAALDAIADRDFGVMVLELGLTGTTGLDVLRRVRDVDPAVRVIVLAVQAEQDAVLEALRLDAADYLAKPLHDEELILAVRRALDAHETEAQGNAIRQRVCALDAHIAEIDERARACDPGERTAALAPHVAEAVSIVLEAGKASVLVMNDSSEALVVAGAVGHDLALDAMDTVALGKGVAGVAVSAGEPIVVGNLDADDRFAGRATQQRYSTRSLVVTPVPGADRPLGVLCATDRADGRPFGSVDLALLRIFAVQVGRWLAAPAAAPLASPASSQPSPLELRADASHEEPEALPYEVPMGVEDSELARMICDVLVYENEPDRVISGVLGVIARLVPASPVALYLIDNRHGTLELEGQVASAGPTDRQRLERSIGLTGMVLQTGNLVATHHPDKDPRFVLEADTPDDDSIRPLICVPIRMRGKSLGVLRVFPLEEGAARPRTAEILATATSAAVRNVLLYRNLLDSIDEVARVRREGRR